MAFRVLGDWVLVRRAPPITATAGGLVIPENVKEDHLDGTVVQVGAGKWLKSGARRPPGVKAGERVQFAKWAGGDVEVDGEELVIMREDEIVGVVEA